ncbi:MAG: polysaccharide deacetylase family protein [Pseudomonadota bacterium]
MTFILNFHGLGTPKRPYEEGEAPYWISESVFHDTLDLVERTSAPLSITFDDGNDSDYHIAVPELRRRAMKASFFVLVGKLDQTGYLTSEQVAEIDSDPLFAIGSHGMDHQPWPDQDDAALTRELVRSRDILSQICGRSIDDAGLPFGRYDRRVMQALKQAGYGAIYSSDGGPRLSDSNPIPRFSVRKDTSMDGFGDFLANAQSSSARVRQEAKCIMKQLVR